MNRLVRFVTPGWITGLSLAAVGIAAARWPVSSAAADGRPLVRLAGETLAFCGLVVIAVGISRRGRGQPEA